MKCKLCDIEIECFKIPYHLYIYIFIFREKECIFRKIQCEYCNVDFPFIEFENHEVYCSSQTVKCDYCNEYIILSNYKQHLAMKHNINVYNNNNYYYSHICLHQIQRLLKNYQERIIIIMIMFLHVLIVKIYLKVWMN